MPALRTPCAGITGSVGPAEIGGVRLTGPYTVAMKLWAGAHTQAGKGPAWFRTDKPSAKEHETAAGCKPDTGYVKAVHAVEVRAQKAAIDKTKKALEDRQAAHERAPTNARKVIAGAS
ncbi:hypothetical protein OZK63_11525 [Streptomyces sp. UMAF16]|nr:hypothetical protein [Streptomyces sp. UMAF16]